MHGTTHVVSYLIHCDCLLQNATCMITKCDSTVITKCDKSLLQKTLGFFFAKCDIYYKMRPFYCKIRQSLQNATFITNCDSTPIFSCWNVNIKKYYSIELSTLRELIFAGINFREFHVFLPKSRNLILAKIMKISKFAKFAKIKFFSSKNRGFLNFLFIQESHKLD